MRCLKGILTDFTYLIGERGAVIVTIFGFYTRRSFFFGETKLETVIPRLCPLGWNELKFPIVLERELVVPCLKSLAENDEAEPSLLDRNLLFIKSFWNGLFESSGSGVNR